ncbi:MAG: ester cyclase [Actinomycetota bacterium]|nr:ester cyclase [Actinomycetota bacterium]
MSETEDLIRRHFEAIEAGNYELLLDLLQPDCELVAAGLTVRGRDNFLRAMRSQGEALKQAFPDLKYEIRDLVQCDDTIVCETLLTGTHSRSLRHPAGEIKNTNKSIRVEGCDYVKVVDGKVASWHSYSDSLALLTQLGLIKPKSGVEMAALLDISWNR